MPELHKLTPPLAVLQGKGFKVALVTDGRMSGASGKVPAAIHVSPEAAAGGPLARLRDGDIVRLDAVAGTLQALVDEAEWQAREVLTMPEALVQRQWPGHGPRLVRRHAPQRAQRRRRSLHMAVTPPLTAHCRSCRTHRSSR
jgi:phosphogluconate dehydratase